MPELCTKVDLCQGHDGYPPRSFATFSPNITVEGFEVVRVGDKLHDHGCSRVAVVETGCASISANGRAVASVGSRVTCDSKVLSTGRPSVLVGEGPRLLRRLGV